MKKQILTLGAVVLFTIGSATFIGCGNSHEQNETKAEEAAESNEGTEATAEQTAVAYTCPMHPEVTGVEGDSCSTCGMALTTGE